MKKIKVNKNIIKKVAKVAGIITAVAAVIGVIKYFTPEEYSEETLNDANHDDAEFDTSDDHLWDDDID